MTHFSLMEIFSIQLTSHLLMFQTMAIFLKQSKKQQCIAYHIYILFVQCTTQHCLCILQHKYSITRKYYMNYYRNQKPHYLTQSM